MLDRVAALSYLVRPDDGGDIIPLRPSPRYVWSKTDSDSLFANCQSTAFASTTVGRRERGDEKTHPLGRSTTTSILRISPEHLAHQPIVTRLPLLHPINRLDLRQQHLLPTEQSTVYDEEPFDAVEEGWIFRIWRCVG